MKKTKTQAQQVMNIASHWWLQFAFVLHHMTRHVLIIIINNSSKRHHNWVSMPLQSEKKNRKENNVCFCSLAFICLVLCKIWFTFRNQNQNPHIYMPYTVIILISFHLDGTVYIVETSLLQLMKNYYYYFSSIFVNLFG
jgi:K+-sensing histidine kinase KdpD